MASTHVAKAPVDHLLNRTAPGLCRSNLKHVFRTESRPWTRDPHTGLLEQRTICQRCKGIVLDWDGPFDSISQYIGGSK